MSKGDITLAQCRFCNGMTDLVCVVCKEWYCPFCLLCCDQCSQPVCTVCSRHSDDVCCESQRDLLEKHFDQFYNYSDQISDNQLADLSVLVSHNNTWSRLREPHLRRLIKERVMSGRIIDNKLFAKYFPHGDVEEDVYKLLPDNVYYDMLIYSDNREEIFQIACEHYDIAEIFYRSRIPEGEALFQMLERESFYPYVFDTIHIGHLSIYKWLKWKKPETTWYDVIWYANMDFAKLTVDLLKLGEVTWDILISTNYAILSIDQNTVKLFPPEKIRQVPIQRFIISYRLVSYLHRIGYTKFSLYASRELFYSAVCQKILPYEKLSADDLIHFFRICRERRYLKVCEFTFPFLSPIRKKKIRTFVLCVRRFYILPRFIIMYILDHCFSPEDERD